LVFYPSLQFIITCLGLPTKALAYPEVQLLNLTIPIIIASTKLTGFHRDPADQIIVATARICGCPLLAADAKIIAYPDVQTLHLVVLHSKENQGF